MLEQRDDEGYSRWDVALQAAQVIWFTAVYGVFFGYGPGVGMFILLCVGLLFLVPDIIKEVRDNRNAA
jgi:hypothetical protein